MSFRWLVVSLVLSTSAVAQPKLRSAVSPDFPVGLHYELINYLAAKLDVPADIALMPFPRRLLELDNGSIDLMVGVPMDTPIGENTQRIAPPYESLNVALFVLSENAGQLSTKADLKLLNIGVTMRSSIESLMGETPQNRTVQVPSIEQKIEMLIKGRIDAFAHIQQGAERKLDELQVQNQITLAEYQIDHVFEQYVVINKGSWLWPYRSRLEHIIKTGIANGDFASIRQRYYSSTSD